jgi:hypothetical protein
VAELDGLARAAAAVGKADEALPHLAVLAVGLRPQVDLDWPVPHAGLAVEGVDLDLVELVDLAALDGIIGLDQPLHARGELGRQWLLAGLGRAAEQGHRGQVLAAKVLGASGRNLGVTNTQRRDKNKIRKVEFIHAGLPVGG